MKYIITCSLFIFFIVACKKSEPVTDLNMAGYWIVQDPAYVNNATADLYHLFKGDNAFYKFSFLKSHDFSNLLSKPRPDSLIAFYKVSGNELMLANTVVGVPGNYLLSKSGNAMSFLRATITKRNVLSGAIEETRTDTIRYSKVTDPVKTTYFDNYLKQWHK